MTAGHERAVPTNSPRPRPLIFISAAEPSADQHAAALIRAVREQAPEARFVGVAGPKMAAAGCEVIYDMTGHAGMLMGALRNAGRAAAMLAAADHHLRMFPFDAAVLLDSPTLHLPLAAKAQAAGVPVMYYIAPQMWAWGKYRIHKLRNRCDRVAVILPFEEEFFRNEGVEARYVGHPLAEQIEAEPANPAMVEEIRSQGSPVVALLPGSRKHVVETMLPDQLQVAQCIAREFPKAVFGVSVAGPNVASMVGHLTSRANPALSPLGKGAEKSFPLANGRGKLRLYPCNRAELIEAADLVLATSGTTTLEVALRGRAMIVMYRTPLWFQLVGGLMIRARHLSLPNILAQAEIVPEFMPYYRSIEPIAEKAVELLRSPELRRRMTDDLARAVAPLRGVSASRNAAAMLLELVKVH